MDRGDGHTDERGSSRDDGRRRSVQGLCPDCAHLRLIESEKGSTFLLCTLAKSDPSLPRYPPQPRVVCSGFVR